MPPPLPICLHRRVWRLPHLLRGDVEPSPPASPSSGLAPRRFRTNIDRGRANAARISPAGACFAVLPPTITQAALTKALACGYSCVYTTSACVALPKGGRRKGGVIFLAVFLKGLSSLNPLLPREPLKLWADFKEIWRGEAGWRTFISYVLGENRLQGGLQGGLTLVEITKSSFCEREAAQESQPWVRRGGVVLLVRHPRIQPPSRASGGRMSPWSWSSSGDVETAAQTPKTRGRAQRGREEEDRPDLLQGSPLPTAPKPRYCC